MRFHFFLIVFFIFFSSVDAFCFPLGYIGDLSSPSLQNSIDIFKKMIQNWNKIHAEKIHVEFFDTKHSLAHTLLLEKQILEKKVQAMIGFYDSNEALVLVSALDSARVPTIVVSATNPDILKNHSYVVMILPSSEKTGISLAKKALALGLHRLLCITNIASTSDSIEKEFFKNEFEKRGGKVLDDLSISLKNIDILEIAKKVKKKSQFVDAITVSAETLEFIYFWRQLKQVGFDLPILASASFMSEKYQNFIQGSEKELDIYLFPGFLEKWTQSRKVVQFFKKYASFFDKKTDLNDIDMLATIDATNLLFHAIEKNDFDSDLIMKKIKTCSFSGVTGYLSFDAGGLLKRPVSFYEIRHGKVFKRN